VIKKRGRSNDPKVTAATRMGPAAMSVWLNAKRSADLVEGSGFRV